MALRNYNAFVAAAALLASMVTLPARAAPPAASRPLGLPNTAATADVPLKPFTNLPAPSAAAYHTAPGEAGRIAAGTAGMDPPVPARTNGALTLAILGDLAPVNPSTGISDHYLKLAVEQLNLLRPDMVLTVGNLVAGETRDGARYAAEVEAVRGRLNALQMPWYPCAGVTDVISGTRQTGDRRFEALYQKYQGPLYYSVDTGDVHAIVLDSEEAAGGKAGAGGAEAGISDAQFAWLKGDLNRAFDQRVAGKRAQWIVVVVHRPLWLEKESAGTRWARVHALLVEFNRRPIVSVEGAGDETNEARGPRVVTVVAGDRRAYAMSGINDGIRYDTLGPTAALPRMNEDAVIAVSGFMLLKLEPEDGGHGGVHAGVLRLGAGVTGGEPMVPEDFIGAHEREMLDAIADFGNDVIGIDGLIDLRSGKAETGSLRVRLKNPLADPIDIAMRSASVKFLGGAGDAQRELANTYVEGFDLPWELSSRHMLRHLNGGATDGWEMDLARPEGYGETEPGALGGGVGINDAPPQVEFVVHQQDAAGVGREVVLKRRVPVAGLAEVPVAAAADTLWKNAASGGAFAWELRGDEPRKLNPSWQMASDRETFFVRVRVDDAVHSYWPRMTIDAPWGGVASDAVSVAWARDEKSSAESVQRIWVMPFGPQGAEIWTNTGIGFGQTELLGLNPATGVRAETTATASGYEVTVRLPRALVFGPATVTTRPARTTAPVAQTAPAVALATTAASSTAAATGPATTTAATRAADVEVVEGSAVMNVSVCDNNETARTWVRSWSQEELGPAGWGKVELLKTATIHEGATK